MQVYLVGDAGIVEVMVVEAGSQVRVYLAREDGVQHG